jgi:hypothetical protein
MPGNGLEPVSADSPPPCACATHLQCGEHPTPAPIREHVAWPYMGLSLYMNVDDMNMSIARVVFVLYYVHDINFYIFFFSQVTGRHPPFLQQQQPPLSSHQPDASLTAAATTTTTRCLLPIASTCTPQQPTANSRGLCRTPPPWPSPVCWVTHAPPSSSHHNITLYVSSPCGVLPCVGAPPGSEASRSAALPRLPEVAAATTCPLAPTGK